MKTSLIALLALSLSGYRAAASRVCRQIIRLAVARVARLRHNVRTSARGMIISHRHRFVFVKTHKTASTTVEVFLEQFAGADAVVTPNKPPVSGYTPRNYVDVDNRLRSTVLGMRQRRRGQSGADAYYDHMTVSSIRKRLGRRRWNSYFSFCFERNPWEKVVSVYYWERANSGLSMPFRDFVLYGPLPCDFDRYSLDGTTFGVDFVGRYEHLVDDLSSALARAGIDAPVMLTREKGEYRPPEATVEAMFDTEMSARVEQVFAREIATFGYSCPLELTRG